MNQPENLTPERFPGTPEMFRRVLDVAVAEREPDARIGVLNRPDHGAFAVVAARGENEDDIAGGQEACAIVMDTIDSLLGPDFDITNPPISMHQVMMTAQANLVQAASEGRVPAKSIAAASIVKMYMRGDELEGAYGHIGDTRLLRKDARSLYQDTQDETGIGRVEGAQHNHFSAEDHHFNPGQFGKFSLRPGERVAIVSDATGQRKQLGAGLNALHTQASANALADASLRQGASAALVIDMVGSPTEEPAPPVTSWGRIKKKVGTLALVGAGAGLLSRSRKDKKTGAVSSAVAAQEKRNRKIAVAVIGAMALTAAALALVLASSTNHHEHEPSKPAQPPGGALLPGTTTQKPPQPHAGEATWHPHKFYVQFGSGIIRETYEWGHFHHASFTLHDATITYQRARQRFGNNLVHLYNHPGRDYYLVGNDVRLASPDPARFQTRPIQQFVHRQIRQLS